VCVGSFGALGAVFGGEVFDRISNRSGLHPSPGRPCFYGDTTRLC
jgi:hypothetical protein